MWLNKNFLFITATLIALFLVLSSPVSADTDDEKYKKHCDTYSYITKTRGYTKTIPPKHCKPPITETITTTTTISVPTTTTTSETTTIPTTTTSIYTVIVPTTTTTLSTITVPTTTTTTTTTTIPTTTPI